MPSIKIPLLPQDTAAPLNLQQVFTTVYDRAAYELSLDYGAILDPSLPENFATLLQPFIKQRPQN